MVDRIANFLADILFITYKFVLELSYTVAIAEV